MLPALFVATIVGQTPATGFSQTQARADREEELDFLAPFLGLSPLDAEDLAKDVAEEDWEPRGAQRSAVRSALQGPWWTALVPRLTLALQVRQVSQLSGSDAFGFRSGLVLLLEASFSGERGAAEAPAMPIQVRSSRQDAEGLPASANAGEPPIGEVQAAAERCALVHLEDLSDWRGRARAAAWLPELSVDYRRNVGEIDTLGIRSDLGIDSHNLEDVTRYGARASWQLGQLVFAHEEVAAAQTTLEIQRERQEQVARVTELYFERQRLLLHPAPDGLRLQEVTALLDAATGGFFGQRLRELGR